MGFFVVSFYLFLSLQAPFPFFLNILKLINWATGTYSSLTKSTLLSVLFLMIKNLKMSISDLICRRLHFFLTLPMTHYWFSQRLVKVLKIWDNSPHVYTWHSFRIGAATSAANKGLSEDSKIMLGRWSSSAYTNYICPIFIMCKLTCNRQFKFIILNLWWWWGVHPSQVKLNCYVSSAPCSYYYRRMWRIVIACSRFYSVKYLTLFHTDTI